MAPLSDAEIRRNLWDRAANTWRRLVDTATIVWDTSAPGVASANVPDDGITLAKLADDVYVTGTWTPTLTFATAGDLTVVYSNRVGNYLRVGAMVLLEFVVTTSTFTHTTAVGSLSITGAPFTSVSAAARGTMQWSGITKASYTQIVPSISGTTITFNASGSGVASSAVAVADAPTAGSIILAGNIIYRA